MDVLCLLPLDFFYLKLGVKPLLRLPRCLKVRRVGFPVQGLQLLPALHQHWHVHFCPELHWEVGGHQGGVPKGRCKFFIIVSAS